MGAESDCLPRRQRSIHQVIFLALNHGPVVINLVHDFVRDLNHRVLFFLVELGEALILVEDGLDRRLLLLAFLNLFFVLVFTDGFASLAPSLPILVLLVRLNPVLVVRLPLVLLVDDVLFSADLTILLSLNFALPVFLGSSRGDKAARNVGLAPCNSREKPLVELAETSMVILDILRDAPFNDPFTVGERLVG